MKKFFSLTLTLAAMLSAMAVSAQAADYSFETDGTPESYPSSSYEDVYGSRYNYGGKNVVDYQIPELEYGQLSTTQTGVMEKIMLPSLQGISAFPETFFVDKNGNKKGAKAVNVDVAKGLADVSDFFDTVTTPDTLKTVA